MKKFVLILLTVALTATAAIAQPRGKRHHQRPDAGKMVERRVAMLDSALALTPDQKTAITAIYTNEIEQRQAQAKAKHERPDAKNRDVRAREAKERDAELDAKVAQVLTDEQRAKFEQLKLRRHGEAGKRHGRRGGPKGKFKADAAKADCCKQTGEAKADCCKQAETRKK